MQASTACLLVLPKLTSMCLVLLRHWKSPHNQAVLLAGFVKLQEHFAGKDLKLIIFPWCEQCWLLCQLDVGRARPTSCPQALTSRCFRPTLPPAAAATNFLGRSQDRQEINAFAAEKGFKGKHIFIISSS